MFNLFKKEILSCHSEVAETPYQRAQQEWDDRIGSARVQAKNWRIVAVFSLVISLLILITLTIVLANHNEKIFVAEVGADKRVMNVTPLSIGYNPSLAQREYFIANFIELLRSVPLDPVVAKQNWLKAYAFLSQRATAQLNAYLRQNNPLSKLGKKTVVVKIDAINPIGENSFTVEWSETVVNITGQNEAQNFYSGVFSIILKTPTTQQAILQNPLGIYIVDFSISQKK